MGESITVQARDGYTLGCELVTPTGEPIGAVLIAPAMGVPRRLYASFAKYLAEAGLATLTVDYRGMGHSRPAGSLKGFKAELHEWGELDLAAGVAELKRRFPSVPTLWFGHSVGGQLFGLVQDSGVKAALMVGSQSGYWMNWPGRDRATMFAVWHAIIPGSVRAVGYLPMKAFRQGEDLPGGVAREWARWGRNPEYIWSYAGPKGGLGFTSYTGPLRLYAISDDRYAPPASIEALQRFYTGAQTELRLVRPAQVGAKSIGHFGFFRPSFQSTLWNDVRTWFLEQARATSSDTRASA
jgi:predicted alpha/beta hydrolase